MFGLGSNFWGEERRARRERFVAQDSDSFNKLKIGQICTYIHVFTNLKEIIYISRDSVQILVLCKLMRELRDGDHANVSTDPYHVLLYDTKTTTDKSEWQALLSNAYVWYVLILLFLIDACYTISFSSNYLHHD